VKFVAPNPKPKKPNKVQIQIMPTFLEALANRKPSQIGDFSTFFAQCEDLISNECRANSKDQPDTSAFGRARGDWYEWLFSLGCWEFVNQPHVQTTKLIIPLPNRDKFDYLTLYNDRILGYFTELKQNLANNGVTLSSSNPDFAIVQAPQSSPLPASSPVISANLIEQLNAMCKQLVGQLSFDEFHGFASVKTSVRGDRRLQLPAEAALVKAFYEHLKARLWKTNSTGLKYVAVSMDFTEKDLETLQTAAIHSILSVNTAPEKAVDETFQVTSSSELLDFLNSVLT